MKKILAMFLALMMMCTFAVAEDEEMEVYVFDEALVAFFDGGFAALEQFGLQMYVPSEFVALEITKSAADQGVIALMGREDGSFVLTISHANVAKANGKKVSTLEELVEVYANNGVYGTEIAMYNGLVGMSYIIPGAVTSMGLAFLTDAGTVLTFDMTTAGEGMDLMLAGIMQISVMPLAQ